MMGISALSVPILQAGALTHARAGCKLLAVTALPWRIEIKANLSFREVLDHPGVTVRHFGLIKF